MKPRKEEVVAHYYLALFGAWGRQHWWPARSRFEVIVGAFLTQNTAWTNVERAIANLRRARALSLDAIRDLPISRLEGLVRPSGYFRQKVQRLKNFVRYLDQTHQGSLNQMFALPTAELRQELLALNGVGPETADSILLYAGGHPVFVVDAYTRRILHRHGILSLTAEYEKIRALFERGLSDPIANRTPFRQLATQPVLVVPHSPSRMSLARRSELAQRYNEMHGLIVNAGKHHCHKVHPRCEGCPLEPFLPVGGPRRMPRPLVGRRSAAPRPGSKAASITGPGSL